MLDAAGAEYRALPARIDEDSVKAAMLDQGHGARQIADALAELKAIKVSGSEPRALVLGSDSVVSVGERLFDKPVSRDDAADHLRFFSGQMMELHSAAVIAEGGAPVWRHVEKATLNVRPLSESFIQSYLDEEWPAISGCVGCFRIEGPGVQLFSRISGDHFTVLGMPLLPVLGYLRTRGVMAS